MVRCCRMIANCLVNGLPVCWFLPASCTCHLTSHHLRAAILEPLDLQSRFAWSWHDVVQMLFRNDRKTSKVFVSPACLKLEGMWRSWKTIADSRGRLSKKFLPRHSCCSNVWVKASKDKFLAFNLRPNCMSLLQSGPKVLGAWHSFKNLRCNHALGRTQQPLVSWGEMIIQWRSFRFFVGGPWPYFSGPDLWLNSHIICMSLIFFNTRIDKLFFVPRKRRVVVILKADPIQ